MTFNADKCKVMHIRTNNPRTKYFINGYRTKLGTTEEEKDVGVYVNHSLKPSNHCKRAADKARAVMADEKHCAKERVRVHSDVRGTLY